MISYETAFKTTLMPRTPAIIRLDGKCFHSLTRRCEKPFDTELAIALDMAAQKVLPEIQNSRFAYLESDEISILLIDYNKFASQQWLGGEVQKIVSISASLITKEFNAIYQNFGTTLTGAAFDSRTFSIPREEIENYFIWRQQDASRNSIQSVARQFYSDKELYQKNTQIMQEMIFAKGINWNEYLPYWKRGRIVTKSEIISDIPLFTQNKLFLQSYLSTEEK